MKIWKDNSTFPKYTLSHHKVWITFQNKIETKLSIFSSLHKTFQILIVFFSVSVNKMSSDDLENDKFSLFGSWFAAALGLGGCSPSLKLHKFHFPRFVQQAPELKVETYLSHNLWRGAMDKANLTMSKSFRGKNDVWDQSTFAHRLGLRLSVQKMQILQTSGRQSPNSASLEKKWSTPRSRLERSGLSWKIIGIYIIMGCKYLSARMEKVFTFRCSHHM